MTKGNFAKNKPLIITLISCISVVIILIALIVSVTLIKTGGTTESGEKIIMKGVAVGGVDLSGLSRDEAEAKLREYIEPNLSKKITLVSETDSLEATYADLGFSYNFRNSAENAVQYGHGGFFSSIGPSFKSLFGSNHNIDFSIQIDDEVFLKKITSLKSYDKSVQASYEITDNAIVVTNGKKTSSINPEKIKQELLSKVNMLDFSTLTLSIENVEPVPLDIDAIVELHSTASASAAYYRDEDGNILVSEDNAKITVDINKAKEIIAAHTTPGETYEIPAIVEKSEYTKEYLESVLFRDKLGTYTTSYSSSGANRSHNVALAASSCNEKVLLPGEVFSYNETLGRRTPEAGYKMAGAYLNGATVQEYGGGICQVSSTLYIAVLKANLKIEERLCHMFRVAYVPMGLDATVDYGTVDFKFSNDTEFPIKVVAYTTPSKQVICDILGTKTENFEVTFETTGISSIPYTTEIIEDPTLPIGEEKIEETGSNGSRCTVYRIVSVDGEVKSRTQESTSYYMAHKEVKRVGTMPVPETDPTISEIPEVTPDAPAVTPETPVVTPETPVTTPETPAVTPETSVTTPETPAVTPETPVTTPETPAVTPETPSTTESSTVTEI